MSRYTDHPGATYLGGIKYRLEDELVWSVGHKEGPIFIVKAGTIFDVSVPWYLRWVIDPHNPKYFKAAALHDEMLKNGWAKATAAAEFFNALIADGVAAFERWLMFLGVIYWTVR